MRQTYNDELSDPDKTPVRNLILRPSGRNASSYLNWTVGDVTSRRALQISPELTLIDALQEMRDAETQAALVVDKGLLIGTLQAAAAIQKVRTAGPNFAELRVPSAASPITATLHPKDTIASALGAMHEAKTRFFPVVTRTGEPVGIISADELAACIGRKSPNES
jgi:CBS domain-containing protein